MTTTKRVPLTREDYFAAAFAILDEDGYPGLKLAALCRRLGITTGSFYNHFASWAAFKTHFLRAWLEQSDTVVAAARRESDLSERIELLIAAGAHLPHTAEAALRTWAKIDAQVREVQHRVDQERLDVIGEAVAAVIGDQRRAEELAWTGLWILIGFQQTATHPVEVLEETLLRLYRDATGLPITRGSQPVNDA